ncbi:MAG: GNAT family N-acetyltransferase [Anaerolineae bacterium]|nr:GNAT family N-acetyltransferase [Anaerolineae bacterium]
MNEELIELRRRARLMLDLSAPRDALAAYYALYHDAARTHILIEGTGRVEGFLAICRTGHDLFRPFAVLRARSDLAAAALLDRGLTPHRPYYVITTPDLQAIVEDVLSVYKAGANRIYRLALSRYAPSVNVLVVAVPRPEGAPHFVIRSEGRVVADSGVNWISPHFAELYVNVAPQAQGRGWGKAVLEACTSWVLRTGAQPLYVVSEENAPSIGLAESVGFVDTLSRELVAEGVMQDWRNVSQTEKNDERTFA